MKEQKKKDQNFLLQKDFSDLSSLEAPPRFELGIKVLQTSALPLGYGADLNAQPLYYICIAKSSPSFTGLIIIFYALRSRSATALISFRERRLSLRRHLMWRTSLFAPRLRAENTRTSLERTLTLASGWEKKTMP